MPQELSPQDLSFVQSVLPHHYTVAPSKEPDAIRCMSKTGIRKGADDEDEQQWEHIMNSFRRHFGTRLKEVNANVCFCHTDFTIYAQPA